MIFIIWGVIIAIATLFIGIVFGTIAVMFAKGELKDLGGFKVTLLLVGGLCVIASLFLSVQFLMNNTTADTLGNYKYVPVTEPIYRLEKIEEDE